MQQYPNIGLLVDGSTVPALTVWTVEQSRSALREPEIATGKLPSNQLIFYNEQFVIKKFRYKLTRK